MKPTPTEVTHALLAWSIERDDRSFSGRTATAVLRQEIGAGPGQVQGALKRLVGSGHLDRARFSRGRYSWVPPSERRGYKTAADRRAEDKRVVAKCLGLLRIAGVCEPFAPDPDLQDDYDARATSPELRLSGKEAAKLAALLTILADGGP